MLTDFRASDDQIKGRPSMGDGGEVSPASGMCFPSLLLYGADIVGIMKPYYDCGEKSFRRRHVALPQKPFLDGICSQNFGNEFCAAGLSLGLTKFLPLQ